MDEQALTDFMTLLDKKGVSLLMLRIQDIALERDDALLAVKLLERASMPILGGDVYFERNSAIEPAHANWYTDRGRDEAYDSYLRRSWEGAMKYITTFPKRTDVKPLFSLVIRK